MEYVNIVLYTASDSTLVTGTVEGGNVNLIGDVYDYRFEGTLFDEPFSKKSFNGSVRFNNLVECTSSIFTINWRNLMRGVFFLSLLMFNAVHAQGQAYLTQRQPLLTLGPHHARAIGLGSTYTGVAEGVETVFYNSAGLARLEHASVIYSSGQGIAPFIFQEPVIYDVALAIPIPSFQGGIGISHGRAEYWYNWKDRITSLHIARKILPFLMAGLDLHYLESDGEPRDETGMHPYLSGEAFNASISLFAMYPGHIVPSFLDQFQVGVMLRNILTTKWSGTIIFPGSHSMDLDEDRHDQQLRVGASYHMIPPLVEAAGLVPLQALLAMEMVVQSALVRPTSYKSGDVNLNFGIEVTVFEMLRLRYGRETLQRSEPGVSMSLQYPVTRYGIGAVLPVRIMQKQGIPVGLEFDYAYSDWDQIDESALWLPGRTSLPSRALRRDAFSLKVNATW